MLKWALVVLALVVSSLTLYRFSLLLRGEISLVRAAEAGVLEATLPRATARSVSEAVRRQLLQNGHYYEVPQILLSRNGVLVSGPCRSRRGDSWSVQIAARTHDFLPGWLSRWEPGRGSAFLTAGARREMGL